MPILDELRRRFGDAIVETEDDRGELTAIVARDALLGVLAHCRDEAALAFDVLMDLTAVDYLNQGKPERFAVVYSFYSVKENVRARVKAWVPEADPTIDSASQVYRSAPWAEREVWDLMGIKFNGHPDLKRIQLPENYEGHPLRKDYPLTGRGERMNFPRYIP